MTNLKQPCVCTRTSSSAWLTFTSNAPNYVVITDRKDFMRGEERWREITKAIANTLNNK